MPTNGPEPRRHTRPSRLRRHAAAALLLLAGVATVLTAQPAAAHGFSTTVFADASSPQEGVVRVTLGLEYELLVVSVADSEKAPQLYEDGEAVFQTGDEITALGPHTPEILRYVDDRFTVTTTTGECTPAQVGDWSVEQREGVPYAFLTQDYTCPRGSGHEFHSGLFPDSEGYVTGAVTVLTYDLDTRHGSAALDQSTTTFSTQQSLLSRYREFFVLGAEHLLTGLDHILFLLALIVGSRRLRDVVLAASSFTLAHSVTFILAALGVVAGNPRVVEPTIALSIAAVAAWYLWRLYRGRNHPEPLPTGRLGLDRADWVRLAVVFCFGLVHGLGFAGALGIDEPFSWPLLSSLLVFNVGIEAVQISLIALVFPLLTLLRNRAPRPGTWVGATVALSVSIVGLVWFGQRVAGIA